MVGRCIAKQILGTVVAVLAGWLAAFLFLELMTVAELLQQPHYIVPEALFVGPITASLVMAYFIIPIWLVVLVPLYLFVPSSSTLWRWQVCTALGAVAGIAVITLWLGGLPGLGRVSPEAWSFYVMAAIVGGITCLTGALTHRRFKRTI